MAPRAPKTKGDDDEPLKPKVEKAKVTKTKSEKTDKPDKSKKDVKEKEKEKGDKIKPVTGDEAMELIEEYLRTQNRPYSATEVSANLHGKVSPCILS
jgi:26S proteasome regulatory subunit (ATPase 3-interacting protein)